MSTSSIDTAWQSSQANTLVASIASETSQTPTQPSKQVAEDIDSNLVAHIEERLERFQPLLKPRSQRRAFFGIALKSSGSTLNSSGASSSAANLGAASITVAKLSEHLDQILQQTEGKSSRERDQRTMPLTQALNLSSDGQ